MTSSSSSPSSSAAAAAAASKQPSTKPFIPSASSATATTTSGGGSLYRNLEKKAEEINLVLLQPTVDLWKLRELALTDGGLVNDTLRKRAWPKLVGLQKYETSSSAATTIPDAASIIQETTTTTNKPETTASPYSTTTTTTSSRYNNNLNARTLIHSTTIDEEDQQRFEIDTALVPDADAADKDKENTTALSSSSPPSGAYSILGNTTGTTPYQTHTSYADLLVQSMDVEQIERDVSRCTWHLLTGSQRSRRNQIKLKDSPSNKKVALLLKKKQRRLANLINLTLVESYAESTSSKDSNNNNNNKHKTDIDEDDKLRYYQGYHDVACIFMHALGGGQSSSASSVLSRSSLSTAFTNSSSSNKNKDKDKDDPFGLDLASRVLCQVSFSHFRDSMRSNFVSLQTALKLTLYPLLAQLDPQVHNHLKDVDMEPFFCLSWVLTWFSHDVRDTNLCKRLFDAFLSSHPLLVLYVSLAMMLHPYNRQLILDTDCDFAALHQCLASLPRNSCKVGWKRASWEQGGGYISDDDEDDDGDGDDDEMDDEDDQTASTDMDTCSSVLQPPSVQTSTPSVYSASSSVFSNSNKKNNQLLLLGQTTIEEGKEQRVPFQELIDTALQYMARYPPRSLEAYARRYYARQQQQQQQDTTGMMFSPPPLSTATSGISLLQEPPTWSLISMTPSDWVLKQRLRQEMGLKATSRKDRRKKAKALSSSLSKEDETAAAAALAQALDVLDESSSSSSTFSKPDYEYLKRHANDRAVIAAGYGPGPEAILERKRKRRRLATAVAVGFLAMTVGLAIQHYGTSSTTTEPRTTNNIASSRSQNKANFVKSLLHPHRPETTSSLTSAAASTASGAAAILSTSAASAATTTSSTDTIASVADYCKSPMTCVLNNQSTQAEYEEEEEVKSKNKNEANEGSTITATTSSKASSSSSLHRPRQVTLGGGSTQPPIAARPAEWNVSSKSSLSPPGTSSSTLTTLSSSSNNNNNSHSRILTTRTYSSFFLWGGKMVERWTLKLLRLFLQPLRWILSGMGGRKSNNKSNTKSNSNKTIKTGHRVVLGNLWAWLDQKVDSSLALLD